MPLASSERLLPPPHPSERQPCAASPGGQLPTAWLVLQQLSAFPSNVTWGLATSILLPVSVATIVCPEDDCNADETVRKGSMMATAAFCGAVAQLSQPFWGALSDRLRPASPYWGRRRVVVASAQLATVASLLGMALATNQREMSEDNRFYLLTAAYTAFQVANSMFSAPYYSIVPELVSDFPQIYSILALIYSSCTQYSLISLESSGPAPPARLCGQLDCVPQRLRRPSERWAGDHPRERCVFILFYAVLMLFYAVFILFLYCFTLF